MSQNHLEETFVETISAVNFSNGIVRLFFAGQDLSGLIDDDKTSETTPENRFCVTMPLAGFLYAMTVVQGFVENDKFKSIVDRSAKAGFLPGVEADETSQSQSEKPLKS
ncbi:MAG: hypothetical protein GY748_26140 [Planctomycetaceae bacterium]|nr:hypothetical protein [Planctomycetaceae bacterium]